MPCPIRFGPPPRMITFFRSVGCRLALVLVRRVHVRRAASRTRRRTCRRACRPAGCRAHGARPRDRVSFVLQQVGEAAIREAHPLQLAQVGRADRVERALVEHELEVDDLLDLREEPRIDLRVARAARRRSCRAERVGDVQEALARADTRARRRWCRGSTVFRLKPSTPTSSPRSAFCSDSWNVRPIAITSPTDFICVVRRSSACVNFSNANRGTFVTT